MHNISVKCFLNQQFINGEFNRYDIFVRLLFIDCFYSKNNYGLDLYRKQEQKRTGNEDVGECITDFQSLKDSFAKVNFIEEDPIDVNEWLGLTDGAHRIACMIYFDYDKIYYNVTTGGTPIYGKQWYIDNDFTSKEIELIENKKKEVFKKYDITI